MGHADPGEEHAKVVVDLGDRADGRAWILRGRLLLDGDRRRQPLDRVDVGLLHLLEELTGIGRERLDVAPLPLGVDGVEGERRFARAGEPRQDDQLIAGNLEVYGLEVVLARPSDDDPVIGHEYESYPRRRPWHNALPTVAALGHDEGGETEDRPRARHHEAHPYDVCFTVNGRRDPEAGRERAGEDFAPL